MGLFYLVGLHVIHSALRGMPRRLRLGGIAHRHTGDHRFEVRRLTLNSFVTL